MRLSLALKIIIKSSHLDFFGYLGHVTTFVECSSLRAVYW